MAIIASVIAMVLLIVGVTAPLLRRAHSRVVAACALPEALAADDVLGLGVDMGIDRSRLTATLWTAAPEAVFVDLTTGEVVQREPIAQPAGAAQAVIASVEALGSGRYGLAWSNGAMSLIEVAAAKPPRAETAPASTVRVLASVPAEPGPVPVEAVIRRSESGAVTRAARFADGRLSIVRQVTTENLLGEQESSANTVTLEEPITRDLTVMTMDQDGAALYAGTRDGRLARWFLDEQGAVRQRETPQAFADRRAVTAATLVLGDVSLAVGDAQGELTTWFPVSADDTRKLHLIHRLRAHGSPLREIHASGRNKSLVSLSEDGTVHLDYMTSERHLLSIPGDPQRPLRRIAYGPRGDVLVGLDSAGALTAWAIDAGHPEISLQTLFGRVFYEGYDRPEFVWQTTGGEDFEPKMSLVPLLFGTVKGTVYAMLFAVPIALFGAAYTSHFTSPRLRRWIKPTVEIMAAVPSVVIGFLIALWLAPILERGVLAFFLSLATLPAAFVLFMAFWQGVRRWEWAKRVESGYEFLVLVPVLVAGVAAAVWLARPLEAALFDGNFKQWLFSGPLGVRYDQRNSIIIAFGLGFTVIPIIFSIAEDSLGNVPHSMTAASMALGASRWQTLWRVVLPSASPGIFAAVMIGFGRAVGETMIVLMATGNTPILDFSPLNGMRTLSANIAVEIPEAPVGGTLYRVLFLCAVLLFLLTFTVNTAAELVRQRLRKRYGRL